MPRKIVGSVLFLILILCASAGFAQAPLVLASASFLLDGPEVWNVHKILENTEIFLIVLDKDKKEFWRSGALGTEDRLFQIEGVATPLSVADLDGDKIPEVFTAVFYGPKATGLYGFRVDAGQKKLIPITVFMGDSEPRDFLVADIHVDDGGNLLMDSRGKISVMGMAYEEEKAIPAKWDFELTKKGFELQGKRLLPPPSASEEKAPGPKKE